MKKIIISLLILCSVVGTNVDAMHRGAVVSSRRQRLDTIMHAIGQNAGRAAGVVVAPALPEHLREALDDYKQLLTKQEREEQYVRSKTGRCIKWTKRALIAAAIVYAAYSVYNPKGSKEIADFARNKVVVPAAQQTKSLVQSGWAFFPEGLRLKITNTTAACVSPIISGANGIAERYGRISQSVEFAKSCAWDHVCKDAASRLAEAKAIADKLAAEKKAEMVAIAAANIAKSQCHGVWECAKANMANATGFLARKAMFIN